MNLDEKVELTRFIVQYAVEKYPRIFAACSFGKDSRVLVDLATKIKPDILFIGIDTGYEFPETLSFAGALIQETGMNFRWARPSEEARKRIDAEFGDSFIREDQYKCCALKSPAIEPVMADFDAWITGLRRDETAFRKKTRLVENGRITKVNPIAFWTKDDVWQYIAENNLSYHPLYDEGFASLGCQPCTRASRSEVSRHEESERAGRFAGTSHQGQECGLHLS